MMAKVTVVVPTYNEVENLRPLTERLFAAASKAKLEVELVFAEDESVGTPASVAIVTALEKEGYAVAMRVRRAREGRGLSSAVLLGFDAARHDVLVCMDADLQHEPESVPAVVAPVVSGAADFAIGSRNVADGGVGFEWSLKRQIISKGATLLAMPLTASTDPMSGFFCVRKDTLAKGRSHCNPRGFKIALEIMVRCRCKSVVDVPITFRDRAAGESKLTMRQNIDYVRQLIDLYCFLYKGYISAAAYAVVLLVLLFSWVAIQSWGGSRELSS
ncbi:hypothetical protein CTAYLR_003385 [Chrysophaeum taylorii]|uniref:Dolichol-phosphate mannosyltransferase subunit 1 n=1 Tax=Chrysophaeum taylorii TaxID=2483200 RepID=A0AAD7UFG1_9STRA|nr:hypothetical protein CTAYLR_003385 [Chrysophaeum taylorii]